MTKVPQGKTAPKRANRARKVTDFAEFSFGTLRGRFQIVVQRGGEQYAEIQAHDGKVDLVSARLNIKTFSLPGVFKADPKLRESLTQALMALVETLRDAGRTEAATARVTKERTQFGLRACLDAQTATVAKFLGHDPAQGELVDLTPEQTEEVRKAGEAARAKALAEYDAAHGSAEA